MVSQKNRFFPEYQFEKYRPIFTPRIWKNIKPENEQPYLYLAVNALERVKSH